MFVFGVFNLCSVILCFHVFFPILLEINLIYLKVGHIYNMHRLRDKRPFFGSFCNLY